MNRPLPQEIISPSVFPDRSERKRFLAVTNGAVTEYGYLVLVNQLTEDAIIPEFVNQKMPSKLVAAAVTMKEKAGENGDGYDEVAVICDIDDLLDKRAGIRDIPLAISLAEERGVQLCFSNQSFEIWLRCHIDAPIDPSLKDRKIAKGDAVALNLLHGRHGKVIVPSVVTKSSIRLAISNAENLRRLYGPDITKATGPVTDVDKFIRKIDLNS